jgi:hypothetical protein
MSGRSDFQNLCKGAEKEKKGKEKTKRSNRGRVRERGACGCRGEEARAECSSLLPICLLKEAF